VNEHSFPGLAFRGYENIFPKGSSEIRWPTSLPRVLTYLRINPRLVGISNLRA
jgi:hypothetical protein